MACAYADVFGRPGEGVHAYRFLGIAAVDAGLTLAAAVAASMYYDAPLWKPAAALVAAGIAAHYAFCVPTTLNKALGLA